MPRTNHMMPDVPHFFEEEASQRGLAGGDHPLWTASAKAAHRALDAALPGPGRDGARPARAALRYSAPLRVIRGLTRTIRPWPELSAP